MNVNNKKMTDYKVHNLTFLRNNNSLPKIVFDKNDSHFIMMNDSNLWIEKKSKQENDGYRTFAESIKIENNTVERRMIGIYSRQTSKDEQLFKLASKDNEITSEAPFLGIIQVYIADYRWKKAETFSVCVQQMHAFLKSYEMEIERSVNKILSEEDTYQIYRTYTSEDFCVIIRTPSISKIYHVVLEITDIKNLSDKMVFYTYTTIGIECAKCKQNIQTGMHLAYENLHNIVPTKNQNVNFLLRFHIRDVNLDKSWVSELQEKNKCEDIRQMIIEDINRMPFGHEFVVRMSMDEFTKIYSYLCMNISGDKCSTLNLEHSQNELSKILIEKMSDGTIQIINMGLTVNCHTKEKLKNTRAGFFIDEEIILKIENRNRRINEMYNGFKKNNGNKFSIEKYRYTRLIYMMDILVFSFEKLAYNIDTHINWFIYSQYLENFLSNMISYMDFVKEDAKCRAIEKFLDEFQDFISTFDLNLHFLQGIGQNTIQSLQYDMGSYMIGQKFFIAYSEFIDSLYKEYCEGKWNSKDYSAYCEPGRTTSTIICPDLSIKMPQFKEVFSYDKFKKSKNNCIETATLICRIPVDYFECPYELIPLMIHGICNQMLILKRSVRNEFLLKNIFERVAAEAVYQVLARYVKGDYVGRVDALTKFMQEKLSETLVEIFKEKYMHYEEYVFRHLTERIRSFIHSYFDDKEKWQNNFYRVSSLKCITEDFELLIREIYDDETTLKAFHNIQIKNITEFSKPEVVIECIGKLIKFTSQLLNQINRTTINYKYPIALNNLWGKSIPELDDYLLQWAKDNVDDILNDETEKTIERTQLLKNYLELTKRAILLLSEAICFRENYAAILRKELAKKFEKKAKKELLRFRDKYYYIFDQDKVKKTAFWEFEHEECAQKHFIEAMGCIDNKTLIEAVEFSVTNYKIVCADIIMCKWLGFSSFGYYRFAVTLTSMMQGNESHIEYGSVQWERLVTVLAVLVMEENSGMRTENTIKEISLSGLQTNIWEYINETLKCVKTRTWAALATDDNLDKEHAKMALNYFYEMVEENVNLLKEYVLASKKIVWEGSVWDRLNQGTLTFEKMDDYFPYFAKEVNIFKRIYDMLEIYGRIQSTISSYIKSDIYEHSLKIYRRVKRTGQYHEVVKEVASFYNDPASEKKPNSQKMTDMLLFVQDYYYCNRIKKARENEWVPGMQKA